MTVRLPDPDIWIYDMERGSLRRMTLRLAKMNFRFGLPDGNASLSLPMADSRLSWLPWTAAAKKSRY